MQGSVGLGIAAPGIWLRACAEEVLDDLAPVCALQEAGITGRELQRELAATLEAKASRIRVRAAIE